MASFIPPELKRFRAPIIPGAIFIFLLMVVFTFVGTILLDGLGNTLTLRYWRILLGTYLFVGAPFSILGSLILVLRNPVAFSNHGIYAFSFSGKKCFLRWEDILQVQRFKLLNLTWLRVYSKSSKHVLWLPLFHSHPAEFLHEIGELAPANSPVRYFLRPGNS
jgi:hypothetical protein